MQWEQWRNNSDALVAGPIPAGEYTTLPVALQPSDVALQGSFTIYLGANRGRGQAYPNGAASSPIVGMTPEWLREDASVRLRRSYATVLSVFTHHQWIFYLPWQL